MIMPEPTHDSRGDSMLDSEVQISVVVASCNGALKLPDLLIALSGQTIVDRVPFEVVLVDNCSTDNTAGVIRSFASGTAWSIRYAFERRSGKAYALNTGVKLARGPIIAFTDDDGVPAPDWLERILEYFSTHENIHCLGGRVELYDPQDLSLTFRRSVHAAVLSISDFSIADVPVIGCNLAIRASELRRVGPYDTAVGPGSRVGSGDDVDMLYRLLRAGGQIAYVPSILVHHNQGCHTRDRLDRISDRYTVGRGAFYLKYVLHRDRRIARFAYWELVRLLRSCVRLGLVRREARAALRTLGLLAIGASRYIRFGDLSQPMAAPPEAVDDVAVRAVSSPVDRNGVQHPTAGVIVLVPDRWNDICMARHQVTRRLASHFPVVWIEPTTAWQHLLLPTGTQFLEGDRWTSPVPGLEVLTPGFRHSSLYHPRWLRRAIFRSLLRKARTRLINRGARDIVLYLWRSDFSDALGLVSHDVSCYHIDDEYTFSEIDVPNSLHEIETLHAVDQVIVHSEELLAKKGGVNPLTALVQNGVDFKTYSTPSAEPPSIATIPRPRIGYVGVIKKQLDLALVARLARARPLYSYVFVGPILNVQGKERHVAELQALPNVHFLGEKPAEDLHAYVQHLDVCLMCYEVNGYTKYINPLKLHEYMAAGRPVVSSGISAVRAYFGLIRVACTDSQWLEAIDASLDSSESAPARARARQARAAEHDWGTLVTRITLLIRDALGRVHTIARPRRPTRSR